MRKHTTQAEIHRINKLLRAGVTEVAEIQAEVFVHAECIERIITKFENQKAAAAAAAEPAEPAKPTRKKVKKAAVDPLT